MTPKLISIDGVPHRPVGFLVNSRLGAVGPPRIVTCTDYELYGNVGFEEGAGGVVLYGKLSDFPIPTVPLS